jgi:CheY-like chemotaxis protein
LTDNPTVRHWLGSQMITGFPDWISVPTPLSTLVSASPPTSVNIKPVATAATIATINRWRLASWSRLPVKKPVLIACGPSKTADLWRMLKKDEYKHGYKVVIPEGESEFAWIQNLPINLSSVVLVDIGLQGLDAKSGVELLKSLRAHAETRDMAVITLASKPREVKLLREADPDAVVLIKPISETALLAELRKQLR